MGVCQGKLDWFASLNGNKKEVSSVMPSLPDIRVFRGLIRVQHYRSTDLAEKLSSDNNVSVLLQCFYEVRCKDRMAAFTPVSITGSSPPEHSTDLARFLDILEKKLSVFFIIWIPLASFPE